MFFERKTCQQEKQHNSYGFIIIWMPAGRPPEKHQCCKTAKKVRLASLGEADETSPALPRSPKSPRAPKSSPRHSSRDKHYINKLPINRPSGRLV